MRNATERFRDITDSLYKEYQIKARLKGVWELAAYAPNESLLSRNLVSRWSYIKLPQVGNYVNLQATIKTI